MVTKPEGIVSHSYDIYFRQNTKKDYDAYINSGLEWLKSKDKMNVFWEERFGNFDKDFISNLFGRIVFENPMVVAETYMWQQERNERQTPLNWMTVLTAAVKKNNLHTVKETSENAYCHPCPPCREAGVLLAGIQSLKTILKMDDPEGTPAWSMRE